MSDFLAAEPFLRYGFPPTLVFVFSSAASLGINIWVTFVAGPVMIQTIDRHTFLKIQSKMFPVYFTITGILSSLQLASILYCSGGSLVSLSATECHAAKFCGVALASTLVNGLIVGPRATEIFTKKMMMEKEEGVIYPKVTEALKEDKTYKSLVSTGKKIHIASMLLGMTGTCVSFYMMYFITKTFRG